MPSTVPLAEQRVTASDLVRHFGTWQERAARAPVYVLHRGRPRFALLALDLMDALCAPHATTSVEAQRDAIIDALPDTVLLADDAGRIVTANPAARARFGAAARAGSLVSAMSERSGGFLTDAMTRVLAGGAAETLDVAADRLPERRLCCTVSPLPSGVLLLLLLRDTSPAEELHVATAMASARTNALALTDVCAAARINLRGRLLAPDPALSTMTGVAPEQLAQARFATLIAIADRVNVDAAIEEATLGRASRIEASLLVRGAPERRVALGLSPVYVHGRVEEIAAAIAAL